MSETKEEAARRRWLAIQEELNPGETEISRTLDNIAAVNAGLHRVRNEDGKWAYFPNVPNHTSGSKEQRALEDAWEIRAGEMHQNQTTLIPKPKPVENSFDGKKITRGD